MAYTSLKDLYSGQVMLKHVPPLPRQAVRIQEQAPVPSVPAAAPTDGIPVAQPVKFDPTQITDWTAWSSVNVPQDLFEIPTGATGEGRGEYSVASFLSGLKDRKQIDENNLVQGGNASFDVAYGGKEYEVKQLNNKGDLDVRIGTEGIDTANTLKQGLITATKIIRSLYNSLTRETQNEVNGLLKQKFNIENFNLGVYLSKFSEGKLSELPSRLLGAPGIFCARNKGSDWSTEPSILTAVNSIIELQNNQTTSNVAGAKNPRVQALLDLISKKEMYGVEGDNKANFYKQVEKELESLDRDLASKRCEFSEDGKYCATLDTFIQEIRNRNLLEDIQNLITTFKNDVLNIFPKQSTFAGLFIVSATKFKYIPKNQLTQFIENSRLSQNKPKIRLKP